MSVNKLASFVAALAILAGAAALASSTPARATPPPKCTIEEGDPGCAPCTIWNPHRCRCVKIPACKL